MFRSRRSQVLSASRQTKKRRQTQNKRRLLLEQLEDRRLLASYVVTTNADSGEGSLREAIGLANASIGVADVITFDQPYTISLEMGLPTVTGGGALTIDGSGVSGVKLNHSGDWSGNGLSFDTMSAGSVVKGLEITGFDGNGISIAACLVAGNMTIQGNIIHDNTGHGVLVQGTIESATTPKGISIVSNSIYANAGLGINLQPSGETDSVVTANDAADGDSGPNNLQNYPVLTSAAGSTIVGTLNSAASTTFTVQFFASAAADASGYGEGQTYLGQLTNVSTDGSGSASFNFSYTPVPGQTSITATATDPDGNTSEFSPFVAEPAATDDFGDAPDTGAGTGAGNYQTIQTDGGAYHATTGPTLGTYRDAETDGQPTTNADGDDNNGSPDDEDGVSISNNFTVAPSGTARATISAPAGGVLDAWLDFNADGDWVDAGEQIATNLVMSAGTNYVDFAVPAGATLGTTYARFRIAAADGDVTAPTGSATNGEVEDYAVTISVPSTVYVDDDWATGGTSPKAPGDPAGSGVFGYNAFGTIQAGINAVATGGTVDVAAGAYSGNVSVGKQVSLIGDPATPPTIAGQVDVIKSDNVVIQSFNVSDNYVYLSNANNADIDDLAVSGGEKGLWVTDSTGGTFDGVNLSSITRAAGSPTALLVRNGGSHRFTDLTISDVTTTGGFSWGVNLGSSSNNVFQNTTIKNVQAGSNTSFGIYLVGANGNQFTDTVIDTISGLPGTVANQAWGVMLQVSSNNTFTNYTATNLSATSQVAGIAQFYEQSSDTFENVLVENVSIVGSYASATLATGIAAQPQSPPQPTSQNHVYRDVVIRNINGLASTVVRGVYLKETTNLQLINVDVSLAGVAGNVAEATGYSLIRTVDTQITASTSSDSAATGAKRGVYVSGGSVDIDGMKIYGNETGLFVTADGQVTLANTNFDDLDADNQTDIRLEATAGTLTMLSGNEFAGDNYFIDNHSSEGVVLSSYASANFEGLTNNFRIEDKMYHKADAPATSGLVRWVPGNVYVSAPTTGVNDETIQDGIAAAADGDTVHVEAGTYTESVSTAGDGKNVTLAAGSSPARVTIDGDLTLNSGDALLVDLTGATAGSEYDQWVINEAGADNGSVTLDGATLTLNLTYAPVAGAVYTIIDNDDGDAVVGTFGNVLSNGGTITADYDSTTYTFRLFYTGGDGNDVVLVENSAPPTTTYAEDTAWTGLPVGTLVDGNIATPEMETAVIGVSAFTTIQAAINAVVTGGTVVVNIGTYPENVDITKSLTMLGPQAGVEPVAGGRPAGEATVTGSNAYPFVIRANDVTVNGMAIGGAFAYGVQIRCVDNPGDEDSVDGVTVSYTHLRSTQTGSWTAIVFGEDYDGSLPRSGTGSVSDLELSHNLIEMPAGGNRAISAASLFDFMTYDGITITDNVLDGPGSAGSNFGFFCGVTPAKFVMNDLVFDRNEVEGFSTAVNCVNIYGASFQGNAFSDVGLALKVNLHGTDGEPALIRDNVFTDVLTGTAVQLRGTKYGEGDEHVEISGNMFHYNEVENATLSPAVLLEPGVKAGTIHVNNNQFVNGGANATPAPAFQNASGAGIVDAENNWWDSVNGPVHAGNMFNVGSQGADVVGEAAYVRWYDSGVDAQPGVIGFQPAGTLFAPVHNDDTPAEYYSSIQAAVDATDEGGIIYVTGGAYREKVSTEDGKNVTLAAGFSPAQVTVEGNLTFQSGDTLPVELNGVTAGSEYDQWVVTAGNTVNLADATLSVTRGFDPAIGIAFTIIDNQGSNAVIGEFAGLAEGTVVTLDNVPLTISYLGGDGNDVTLTLAAPDEVWANDTWLISDDLAPSGLSYGDVVYSDTSAVPPDADVSGKVFGYNAFATIQAGVNAVVTDGTVNVLAGTYLENVTVGKTLELLGAQQGVSAAGPGGRSGPESVLDGGDGHSLMITASGVAVDGFEITNNSGPGTDYYGVGLATLLTDVTVANNKLLNVDRGVWIDDNCERVTVEGNLFSGNWRGINVRAVTDNRTAPTITGNRFIDAQVGIHLYHVYQGGSQVEITNNYFEEVTPNTTAYGIYSYVASFHAQHNEFVNYGMASIDYYTHGGAIAGVGTTSTPGWGDVQRSIIEENTFTCTKGSAVEGYFSDFLVRNNTITKHAGGFGITLWIRGGTGYDPLQGAYAEWGIENNVIAGPGGETGLYGTGGGYGLSAVSVTQNKISGFADAIKFVKDSQSVEKAAIYNNDLSGNTRAISSVAASPLIDASANWYGTDSAAAVADLVSAATVDYTPWLAFGTEDPGTGSSPGFQGDFSGLWVDDDSPQTTGQGGRIQEAIDLLADGSLAGWARTVEVEAGTYAERLMVNKPLTLQGAQAGVDARGRSATESVIQDPGTYANPKVLIEVTAPADGVMVDGFSLRGDETNTTADTSTIRTWANGVTVQNNLIGGMHGLVYKGGDGLTVDRNAFTVNKGGVTGQPGAITNATISDNSISVGAAPQSDMSGIYLTGVNGVTVSGNAVTGFSGRGIGGSNWTNAELTGNTLTGNRDGISLWGSTSEIDISGSNVFTSNTRYGINVKGTNVSITGNAFDSNTTAAVSVGDAGVTSSVSLSGNAYANTTTGIILVAPGGGLSNQINVSETITGAVRAVDILGGTAIVSSSSFSGNTTAIRVAGGTLSLSTTDFDDTNDNATDLLIESGAGTVTIGNGNQFAGDTYFIDNQSAQNIDLSATSGTTFDQTDNFRIEDKMHHRVDTDLAATNGLISWVAGNLYVTAPTVAPLPSTDSSIQRGIDAAANGDTVNVEAGGYTGGADAATGGKDLTLAAGASPAQVTIDGDFTLNGGDTLLVDLAGATAGTGYDQWVIDETGTPPDGTVTLGGATLSLNLTYAPAVGQVYVIIANDDTDAVVGTFANALNNGDTITATYNAITYTFHVFYTGGDGNDVVLVEASNPPSGVFVDDSWAGYAPGQFIADADDGTVADEFAVFGVNAFATVTAGIGAAATDGTVIVNDGTYPGTDLPSMADGKTLQVTGKDQGANDSTVTIASLDSAAGTTVDLGSNTLVLGDNSTNNTLAGTIAGAGGNLAKQGSDVLTLSGNNTYTGTTSVETGILRITHAAALGTAAGGTAVANNARLELSGGITVSDEPLTISGNGANNLGALQSQSGANTWGGDILLAADGTRIGANGASQTLTVSGVIDDGANTYTLAVRNADSGGTTVLSGANTYGGNSDVVVGLLKIDGADNRLPVGSTLRIGNGANIGSATFDLNGRNQQVAGLVSAGTSMPMTITNNGSPDSTLTVNLTSGANTFAGTLSDGATNSLALTKTGGGALTLSGANSYDGATLISGGVLVAASDTALGGPAEPTSVASGATLRLADGITVTGETVTIHGPGSGSIGALQAGGSAVATWAGDVIIGDATARIGADTGTLTVSGVIDDGPNAFPLNVRNNSGTTILSAVNTYGGATNVIVGTLQLSGGNDRLPTTSVLHLGNSSNIGSATFDLNGLNQTLGGLGSTGNSTYMATTVTNSGAADATLTANVASESYLYGGQLTDGTTNKLLLTKTGSGTQTLAGGQSNTYTGLTSVNDGTLALSKNGVVAVPGNLTIGDGSGAAGSAVVELGGSGGNQIANASDVTIDSDGQLNLNGKSEGIDGLNGSGTVDSGTAGAVTLTVGQSNQAAASFSGSINDGAGTVALTKAGSGQQTLAGANAYSGTTTVSGGVLKITHGQALGNTTGATNVANGAALHLEGGIAVGNETLNTPLLVSLSGNNSWAGDIRAINGAVLTLQSNADKLTVTGNVNATSPDNGAHTFNLTGSGNGEISGAVSNPSGGTVPLNKTGSGTWILSGANTYPNPTNVSAGSLLVNGTNAGSGAVTVSGSAVLGGTGAIAGSVSLASGSASTLSPGSPVSGTADLATGSLTLNSGTKLQAQINGLTSDSQHDQIVVTGSVSLGGATLDTSGSTITASLGDKVVLIDNNLTDAVTGSFATYPPGSVVTVNGQAFRIFYNGNDGNDVVLIRSGDGSGGNVDAAFVNEDWASVVPGEDPDGTGPAEAYLVDAYATIQDAIDNVNAGGRIYVLGNNDSGYASFDLNENVQVRFIADYQNAGETTVTLNGAVTLSQNADWVLFDGTIVGAQATTAVDPANLTTTAAGTIDGAAANAQSLSLISTTDGTGAVTLGGAIGGGQTLSTATVGQTGHRVASIAVNDLRAGTAVSLAATGAVGQDTADAGADVAAASLTADAGTGIDLDTNVTDLSAANSTSGSVCVDEADALNVLHLTNANGPITLTTAAAGNVVVTNLNAGSGAVDVSLANGDLTSETSDPGTPDIVGGDVTLTIDTSGKKFGNSAGERLEVDATVLKVGTPSGLASKAYLVDTAGGVTMNDSSIGAGSGATYDLLVQGGSLLSSTSPADTRDIGATVIVLEVTGAGSTIGTAATPLEINSPTGVVGARVDAKTAGGAGDHLFLRDMSDNFPVGSIDVGAATVTLRTTAGAILDANAGSLNVNATAAALSASTGIGTGVDGALETAVGNLEATTGTGGVLVDNTGALVIGGVSTGLSGVQVTGASGGVTITATAAITVDEGVSAPGAVQIATTDNGNTNDLTVNAAVQSTGASVTLSAGDDFTLAATGSVSAGTTVTVNIDRDDADSGTGAAAVLNGPISSGSGATLYGNVDADNVTVSRLGTGGLTIDGAGSGDTVTVNLGATVGTAIQSTISVLDTGASGTTDKLYVTGGAALSDSFAIDPLQLTRNATETVTYDMFLEQLHVNGLNETGTVGDTFTVAPSLTMQIFIDGDDPAGVTPGDQLIYQTPVGQTGTQTPTGSDSGTIDATGGYQRVTYTEIESLVFGGDVVVVGTGFDDHIIVTATGEDAGSYVVWTDSGSGFVAGPTVGFAGLTKLTFNGLAGDDVMTIAYDPAATKFLNPQYGVFFHGGTQVNDGNRLTALDPVLYADLLGDTLQVFAPAGESADKITHRLDPASVPAEGHDGLITIEDVSGMTDGASTISYTGLEPVLDAMPAVDRAFNFMADAEIVTLTRPGQGGLANKIGSSLSETISFDSPTGSLTIDVTPGSGADVIQVEGVAAGFNADLTMVGGNDDALTFQTADTNIGGGDLNATAASIAFLANFATSGDAGLTALAGSVTDSAVDDGTANVTANHLTISVAGVGSTIGSSNTDRLEINAALLDAGTAGGAGDGIFVADTADGLSVGLVTADAGPVSLSVSGGSLVSEGSDPGAADIVGGAVTLDAKTAGGDLGVSEAARLEIAATTLAASTMGTAGDDMFLVDTAGGLVLNHLNAGSGDLFLTALGGALTDANAAAMNLTAARAALVATGGIGSGDALETTLGQLAASNAASGNVELANTGALAIVTVGDTSGVSSPASVTISTTGALTIGDGGGQDILAPAGTVDLNAAGVSEGAGSIVSAASLRLQGTGDFDLPEANLVGTLAADVLGTLLLTDADDISIGNVLGTAGIATGDVGVDGGFVTINATSGTITVDDPANTTAGTGGGVVLIGSVVVNDALSAGAGTITLNAKQGSDTDLIINAQIVSDGPLDLSAPRDIIINALVQTTGSGSAISVTADSDLDGVGGVWVKPAGQVDSADAATIKGSDLWVTPGASDFAWIDADGTNPQVIAVGNIVIQPGTASPESADALIDGAVQATGSGSSIAISANHDVRGVATGTLTTNGGAITVTADADNSGTAGDRGMIDLAGDIAAGDGTVTFSLADCDGRIDGNVLSTGNLVKNGTGVLRLNGAGNTYAGTTDVNAGTLLVNGALTADTAAVTVHSGATLGGTGTIGTAAGARDVLLETGGFLSPGDVDSATYSSLPGRLTVNGDVQFQAGSTFQVQLNGAGLDGQYDQLRVNGTVDLTGDQAAATGPVLELLDGTGIPWGGVFRIIDNNDTDRIETRFQGLAEGAYFVWNGYTLNISYYAGDDDNDVVLTRPAHLDFNGFGEHTEPGYTGVSPWQEKTGSDLGWVDTLPWYYERFSAGDPDWDKLRYDGQSTTPMGDPLVFGIDVAAGQAYEVMILTGDPSWNHDKEQFQVYDGSLQSPEEMPDLTQPLSADTQVVDTWGAAAPDSTPATWGGGTPNTSAGFYRWIRFTTAEIQEIGGSGLGTILMKMRDRGGSNGTTVIVAMDIRPVESVSRLTLQREDPAGTLPWDALPADGATVDKYTGTGAPPCAVLTVTVSANVAAGWPSNYTPVNPVAVTGMPPDVSLPTFGAQIQADENGDFEFWVQRPAKLYAPAGEPLTEGWTVTVEESAGVSRGVETQPYKAPEGGDEDAFALRFDFGATTSPVQKYPDPAFDKSFLQVVPQTIYNATRGYGWRTRVAAGDRRDNYDTVEYDEVTHNTASALRTDFNSGRNATFRVDLPDGEYSVRLYHSNPLYFGRVPYTTQPFTVQVGGSDPYTVPVIAPGTTHIEVVNNVSVTNGALEILFGTNSTAFTIAGIDISTGRLPNDMPLFVAGDPLDGGTGTIRRGDLQPVVAEAAARWTATGLAPAQAATLASVQYAVADLGGAVLGLANPVTNAIRIDDDGAMMGWSLVTGHWSLDDAQMTNDKGPMTHDGVDLLTVVMHELGHLLGYEHSDDPDDLMAPVLSASPARAASSPFALDPSALTLPPSGTSDAVFADWGQDDLLEEEGDEAGQLQRLPSQSPDLLAAVLVQSGEDAEEAAVPRRSRLQRYERDLDAWFTELAAESQEGEG